jgi:REP element-mobilizing transposase RayT
MAHTYSSVLIHCVFSTKERRKHIRPEFQQELWAYIGGIARARGMKALAVGGIEDHVHMLLLLPADVELSAAMRTIKAGASKWIHARFGQRAFEWQEGYGAFSIGISQLAETLNYIGQQQEHHRHRDFDEEYLAFLKKHEIEYDPGFVLG